VLIAAICDRGNDWMRVAWLAEFSQILMNYLCV